MESLQKLPIFRAMARPTPAPVTPSPPPRPPTESTVYHSTPITSPRSLRQLSVFFFGATFFLASTAITRRAVYRRQLRVTPKFYEANTNPYEHFSPFHDAIMALNLATMNCVSLGMMMMGGTLWAFDISGLREAQTTLRTRLNYESIYRTGEDVPQSVGDLLKASKETKELQETEKDIPDASR
ncbi:hypothetical protein BDV95DRAFT_558285 [Massariosphaeria phaeospora]|uniref:Altered inheritance of mitochondria protein 11 n=1 Tax=Massariosphaeria phaeospora TaxID=100035 RepID=A0A7C8IH28_9PLEO|nr:hypothetical protein BDV95DRAFT_558285 [Massariosphaeria phaeospora]